MGLMKETWIDNKVVLITGASSGIGRNLVKKLILNNNCTVIGVGRNEDKFKSLLDELGDKQSNFSYRLFDVSVEENWIDFAKSLEDNEINVIINNAGVLPPFARFENLLNQDDIKCETIRNTMKTNFMSIIYSCAYIMPIMEKSETKAMINISSSAGLCALPGISIYSASKGAVKNFTESLMCEKDYYVSLVCPGFTKTNIFRNQKHSSDGKLINLISTDVEKMVGKIYKGIIRKKKRMVFGIDAKFMDKGYRLFKTGTLSLCTKVMKKANVDLFKDIFDN
jgi:short-subunit dehydrogenase